jgi:hypothetical protein
VRTTLDWVVGGALVMPGGQDDRDRHRARHRRGRRDGERHATLFGVSPVADGQALTPTS